MAPRADALTEFRLDGPTLRRMREERDGLTQAALAALVGCVRQRVAQWEAASSEALSDRDVQKYLSGLNAYDAGAEIAAADDQPVRP
jgi:transcriptional regulator with XRE-family HTH domain